MIAGFYGKNFKIKRNHRRGEASPRLNAAHTIKIYQPADKNWE